MPRAASTTVIAVLLALAPLVAATYPHLSEPRTYTYFVPGLSYEVPFGDQHVEGTTIEQVCAHRRIVCFGPYEIEDVDVENGGTRYVMVVTQPSRIDVEYNESRESETGPWYVEMPVGQPLLFCYLRCFLPVSTNATLHADYLVRYHDNGFEEDFTGTLHLNTTRALHPYVRPYDPHDPYGPDGYPIYLPRDAQRIVRMEYDENVEPLLP